MPPLILALCILAILLPSSAAQTLPDLFRWDLVITPDMKPSNKSSDFSPSLPTCTPLRIVVTPLSPLAAPPYYMMAVPVNGTPTITSIGADENNLSWNVTYHVGSQLILTVLDAKGNSGGTQLETMGVIAGKSTACVINRIVAPPFTVTADHVKNGLATCKRWLVTMDGGIPPYNLLISTLGADWMANMTVKSDLNAFIYINRAPPNKNLFAAVSDSTGRWAYGTPMVKTKGKKDASCRGLFSSEGDTLTIEEQDEAKRATTEAAQRRHSTIIKVSVSLSLMFLLLLAGGTFLYLRKRKHKTEVERAKYAPTPYNETKSAALSTGMHFQTAENQFQTSSKPTLARKDRVKRATPLSQRPYDVLPSYLDGPGTAVSLPMTDASNIQPWRGSNHRFHPIFANLSATQQWFHLVILATWMYTRLPASESTPNDPWSSYIPRFTSENILRTGDEGGGPEFSPGYNDRPRRPRPI
ncbi:hypothetical protein GALMADRAFT_151430 [Galerina marginata CBS 339.88]|uniref:Uncharacterized protein n=1 Tax=Galerina marginata (strain CBS 339.88) TaxID=685588 RepID=A0A067TXB3_GALM3|nr:hypothetical protein GALMADRAFT_151430 [Galerina marginata CBS 339.88]